MPILNIVAKAIAKPIPRMFSSKGHAIVDYLNIACFLVGTAVLWRRSKNAAMGALVCGTAQLAIALATDYPGGISKAISFRKHGEIDLGLAAMTATMPEFMGVRGGAEKKFFLAEGALITIVHELTRFPETQPKKVGLTRQAA
jgi:hypothetical protein